MSAWLVSYRNKNTVIRVDLFVRESRSRESYMPFFKYQIGEICHKATKLHITRTCHLWMESDEMNLIRLMQLKFSTMWVRTSSKQVQVSFLRAQSPPFISYTNWLLRPLQGILPLLLPFAYVDDIPKTATLCYILSISCIIVLLSQKSADIRGSPLAANYAFRFISHIITCNI